MGVDFFDPLVPTAAAALAAPVVAGIARYVANRVQLRHRDVTVTVMRHRMSVRIGDGVPAEDVNRKILEALREKRSTPR